MMMTKAHWKPEAQIAAFEKARANRAANLTASTPAPSTSSAAPPVAPQPALVTTAPPPAPAPASVPAPSPAAKPRKPQTDKGKKRGHFVRPETAVATHEEPEEEEWYQPPRSGYDNYVVI